MPTISPCEMVGTLRFAHPSDCGLICLARKRDLVQPHATSWHDGQITSDFQKSVKPGFEKYSAFVLTQISRITPPVSRRMRGARDRHERAVRCGGR